MTTTRVLLFMLLAMATSGCAFDADRPEPLRPAGPPQRLNNRSPWFPVDEADIALYQDHCGWNDEKQVQIVDQEVHAQAMRMIAEADEFILGCFFLFDNLYAPDPPRRDLVAEITELLIAKKQENPDIRIVIVLDLLHKAWADRVSPAVQKLHEHGVEFTYSDRLGTRSASRFGLYEAINQLGRAVDPFTLGILGAFTKGVGSVPTPLAMFELDGEPISLNTLGNAAYLKANHRKLLVTGSKGEVHALVTSWNPHNASHLHENHAVAVKGACAKFIYMVIRDDIAKSLTLGSPYLHLTKATAHNHKRMLETIVPALPLDECMPNSASPDETEDGSHEDIESFQGNRPGPVGRVSNETEVAFATEQSIEGLILEALEDVGPGDDVRVQMFFLGRVAVVHALLDAAARTEKPVRIILDPNRTGINYEKDGTPNSQVADYLLDRAAIEDVDVRIRWYATRGEQNHAKAMSITNRQTGKRFFTTGSANWTRKNLGGINLEANIFVRGSQKINDDFDRLFDKLWANDQPHLEFTAAWDDPRYNYHEHNGKGKWAQKQRQFFLFPLHETNGRNRLLESEFVHW